MTIRLKLTLIYSVIIALILIVFSAILYSTQRWTTMNAADKSLNYQFNKVVEARSAPAGADAAEPAASQSHSYGSVYTQIRNLDGDVILNPVDFPEGNLPLSKEGFQVVQDGQAWTEGASLDSGHFLIRSQPLEESGEDIRILQVALAIEDRYQFLAELRNILIIGDTLVIIAAFGIGWALAGLILRPIHRITQTAKTVGEERDFSQRVEHTGPNDEIGQLATTFNHMLTRLQDAYIQVEQALQAQRRFVADASHELRTPLTTIHGNVELLRRDPPISTEDRTDILDDTVEETERLIRLVNDLLALARADAQRPLRSEPIQLEPFLEDVCRQVRLLAPQRTIIDRLEPNLSITADADALKQVLLVLLDNGLKHTPPEAALTLALAADSDRVTIAVSDKGPGIDPSQLQHIFDRFFRSDAARSGGGTGLGLAIADELIKAQGATLAVESQLGQGSTFKLTFPQSALPKA